MTTDNELHRRLESDTARVLRLIARIAPEAGLTPDEIARIDQLAAHTTATVAS